MVNLTIKHVGFDELCVPRIVLNALYYTLLSFNPHKFYAADVINILQIRKLKLKD